jgi:hypothetical protein
MIIENKKYRETKLLRLIKLIGLDINILTSLEYISKNINNKLKNESS